ncbi:MAG: peptide chain release factor N(5)-glutamine methyltransferase [Myxococcota bacterium]
MTASEPEAVPQRWTIQTVLQWTQSHFAKLRIESARLDAELLLAQVLKRDRIFLYTHYDQPLASGERQDYRQLVKRRARYEPIAYILGHKEFFSRSFEVSPDVLIPRPETEHLVEAILEWTAARAIEAPKILDIGCGCGNIAITLACEIPAARLTAIDISPAALEVARRNGQRHGVHERIHFVQGDLFLPLAVGQRFDVIVSNPPYIETTEAPNLPPDVVNYEPQEALFAGADGLRVLERLCVEAPNYLNAPGALVCEFGSTQRDAVYGFLRQVQLDIDAVDIIDLQGHNRGVVAQAH